MKGIKRLFQKLDLFGINFSFQYKNNYKYHTSLGGFTFLLYVAAFIIVVAYYFIPFYNRKNFSIIYYSMNTAITDQIRLKESKAAFAIGLDCPNGHPEDLLSLKIKYIINRKDSQGKKIKKKRIY